METWIDDQRFEMRGFKFVASMVTLRAVDEEFVILKTPSLVRRYLALLADESPQRIVELGVKAGGSTALIALAADPELLLAIDVAPDVPPLLAQLIRDADLTGRVVPAFGLDQADRAALIDLADAHQRSDPFDLVIDDASHVLGPTRSSFEVLFPRLRPGGLYIVEDWSSECVTSTRLAKLLPNADTGDFRTRLAAVNQLFRLLNSPSAEIPDEVVKNLAAASSADVASGERDLFEALASAAGRADLSALEMPEGGAIRPLADLAVEATMISATRPDVVSEVRVDCEWLTVRRGPAVLPHDGFRLEDCWTDFFDYLS